MDLLPSEEQIQIASVVADFLRDQMPINAIRQRRSESSAVDASTWARCGELGWFGLGLPEVDGGVGYGLAEEVLLFRELGRQLAPGPFVSSVLGARVAARAGADDIAAAIVAGTVSVGLAEARGMGVRSGPRYRDRSTFSMLPVRRTCLCTGPMPWCWWRPPRSVRRSRFRASTRPCASLGSNSTRSPRG